MKSLFVFYDGLPFFLKDKLINYSKWWLNGTYEYVYILKSPLAFTWFEHVTKFIVETFELVVYLLNELYLPQARKLTLNASHDTMLSKLNNFIWCKLCLKFFFIALFEIGIKNPTAWPGFKRAGWHAYLIWNWWFIHV